MMRTISRCPSLLTAGFSDYSPKAIKTLFGGSKASCCLDFCFESDVADYAVIPNAVNLSISGAQEKYPAVLSNGRIQIAQEGERSRFILKPAPLEHLSLRKQIPANEHLTMQIASQVYGIETALNGLCFDQAGQPVYITRRFDIEPDGSKLLMEDFASMIGKNEANAGKDYKYEGSYDDIAKCIARVIPASKVVMERFFRLVVFNYIFANGDAHLKNFSVIHRDGDIALAPAYDLINTALHIGGDDLALKGGLSPDVEKSDEYNRTGHLCRLDFERFGTHIGIMPQRVKRILDEFMTFPALVDVLIANSYFHEDKTKRSYKRIIEERRQRFVRESE